jgi:hypothetical protein
LLAQCLQRQFFGIRWLTNCLATTSQALLNTLLPILSLCSNNEYQRLFYCLEAGRRPGEWQRFNYRDKYPLIQDGDKIKFIKMIEANSFKFDVISYIGALPSEFKLQEYIDYEVQFENTFLDPN